MASIQSQNRISSRRRETAPAVPASREARPLGAGHLAAQVVEFRGVSKRYSGGDVGLDEVSFSIGRGEFVFLVGATG